MADKFHLTPEGPKKCRATLRSCKYGTPESHYADEASAQAAFQKQLEEEYGTLPQVEPTWHLQDGTIKRCKRGAAQCGLPTPHLATPEEGEEELQTLHQINNGPVQSWAGGYRSATLQPLTQEELNEKYGAVMRSPEGTREAVKKWGETDTSEAIEKLTAFVQQVPIFGGRTYDKQALQKQAAAFGVLDFDGTVQGIPLTYEYEGQAYGTDYAHEALLSTIRRLKVNDRTTLHQLLGGDSTGYSAWDEIMFRGEVESGAVEASGDTKLEEDYWRLRFLSANDEASAERLLRDKRPEVAALSSEDFERYVKSQSSLARHQYEDMEGTDRYKQLLTTARLVDPELHAMDPN